MSSFKNCTYLCTITTKTLSRDISICCEFFQKLYVSLHNNNLNLFYHNHGFVVSSFKNCTYLCTITTNLINNTKEYCCEFFQKLYVSLHNNNMSKCLLGAQVVVSSFKNCTYLCTITTCIIIK